MNDVISSKATQRLTSLDAFRGIIMISLISHGFGFSAFEGHSFLGFLAHHTEHVEWSGCVYWDLIQPAFMFMVGVAMPFAFAKRLSKGDTHAKIFIHSILRCFKLVLLAALFSSIHSGSPTWNLVNVLPQIAFGYLATMLILNMGLLKQGVIALLIVFIYTIVWIMYPGNSPDGPWVMGNVNMGSDFDLWLMGKHYSGYWIALNAIPSTATIIAGAMCGKLIASDRTHKQVMTIFAIAAAVLIACGLGLSFYIPIIKRILSTSFALYSTGWAILLLLFFYWFIDVLGYKRWCFFMVVVGMNSITAYVIFQLFRGWINSSILVFTSFIVTPMGAYGTVLQAFLVLGAQWYILYFFYKNKIFFKV